VSDHMNINTSPDAFPAATVGVTPGYMSGFGNSFETEAPGRRAADRPQLARSAAPMGSMPSSFGFNPSPRRAAATSGRGCIASGPSVRHSGRFAKADAGLWRTAPCHDMNCRSRATALGSGADSEGGHDVSCRACRP